MQRAIAVVSHHDDHVLWMGGTILITVAEGWHWTLVAMCVPDPIKEDYYNHCRSFFGAIPIAFQFKDYPDGEAFSSNDREKMCSQLLAAIDGKSFDYVSTHSRNEGGEYWWKHPNHFEAQQLVTELSHQGRFGADCQPPAYFSYDVIYKKDTATCADPNANFFLPLKYRELLLKCQLCSMAPDANSSLKNLSFPCSNPEAFEGEQLGFPKQFVRRMS